MPSPIRVRIPETVESAIPKHSAISAPVIRSRRNAAIASTRSSGVRLATAPGRRGAIQQTRLALGPVAADPLARGALADFGGLGRLRQRPPLLDTLDKQLAGLFRLSAALACSFIRCPPWDWVA